jgi:hypothetical protein
MWFPKANLGLASLASVAISITFLYSSLVLAAPAGLSAKALVSKRNPDCRKFSKTNFCNAHLI